MTPQEIDRLRRERDDYKHALEHVAECEKGTCPYCPEEARRVLARNEKLTP